MSDQERESVLAYHNRCRRMCEILEVILIGVTPNVGFNYNVPGKCESSPYGDHSMSHAVMERLEAMLDRQRNTKRLPLVPASCLICGTPWMGGSAKPGDRFPSAGVRVFYSCGASVSVIDREKEMGHEGANESDYCHYLRVKNCQKL